MAVIVNNVSNRATLRLDIGATSTGTVRVASVSMPNLATSAENETVLNVITTLAPCLGHDIYQVYRITTDDIALQE